MATTIKLADKTYTVTALPIKGNREWRKKVETPLAALMDVVGGTALQNISNPDQLIAGLRLVLTQIINAPDLIWEWVCDYAPEIAADKEELEEKATDEEVMKAFVAIIGLVFPLGALTSSLGLAKRRT